MAKATRNTRAERREQRQTRLTAVDFLAAAGSIAPLLRNSTRLRRMTRAPQLSTTADTRAG